MTATDFRRSSHIIRTILFLILLLPPLIKNSNAADTFVAKIAFLKGNVTVKNPGVEKKVFAALGSKVSIGDIVRTGKTSSAQIVFLDDSFVNIWPDTSLQINQFLFDIISDTRKADLTILSGTVRIIAFKKRSTSSLVRVVSKDALISAADPVDIGVSVMPSGTEIVSMKKSIRVKNISSLIIGEEIVHLNQKTFVNGGQPPSSAGTTTLAERKKYSADIRK